MNKKSKLFFVCSFALAMLSITTQQNVKADTVETADSQIENTADNTQGNQTQAVSQATAVENTDQQAQTTAVTDTTDNNATVANATDQSQTATATTQANSTTTSTTPMQAVVTTKNVAVLYTQDGKQISNRALGNNTPWYTDQKLSYNGDIYYRVATNEYTNGKDVVVAYGSAADGDVRVKSYGAVNYSRNDAGFVKSGQRNFDGNSVWKYNRTDNANGKTYYQIANNVWINSDDATTAAVYQNPNGWLQIQNTQIKPSGGNVGYELYNGVEGIKTWLVRRYFGYSNAHTIYDGAVASSVRSLQARKGLPVTGTVDLATWEAMGLTENSWYGIDSYIAPLRTNMTSTRSDHIEAMINEAYRYLGQPWISGASSSPDYGVDCSGLVTQALYASGIDSASISSIQHAQPGNEWNCQMYWNDVRIPQVNFNDRQRGDLIFFTDPSSGMLWHVGILLDASTMIESWPYAVQVHSIYSGRGNIAGVKRVFA